MTEIYYCSTKGVNSNQFNRLLNLLPATMQAEIMRYINANDRSARLLARVMLYSILQKAGQTELIATWQTGTNMKPYIQDFRHFNISHSGDLVMLVVSDDEAGIDIEQELETDLTFLLDNFCEAEKKLITQSEDIYKAFYSIWVKKEALLKAIGTGLVNNLPDYDCSGDSILVNETKWFFHPLAIPEGYSACLCTNSEHPPEKPVYFLPDFLTGNLF